MVVIWRSAKGSAGFRTAFFARMRPLDSCARPKGQPARAQMPDRVETRIRATRTVPMRWWKPDQSVVLRRGSHQSGRRAGRIEKDGLR